MQMRKWELGRCKPHAGIAESRVQTHPPTRVWGSQLCIQGPLHRYPRWCHISHIWFYGTETGGEETSVISDSPHFLDLEPQHSKREMTLFPDENQPTHKCKDRHFDIRWFLPQSHPWARLESLNIYPSIISILWDPLIFPYLIVVFELEETKREERMVWPLLKPFSIPSGHALSNHACFSCIQQPLSRGKEKSGFLR